jgi:MTH538 TIR-like domain (DUF1863)
MSNPQVHVFISHAWKYSHHYDTLAKWIFENPWRFGQATIDFRDFSIPKTDPILNAGNDQQLQAAIYNKIARSHIVVIPTGMYANYSKWIQKELDGADYHRKPILAVDPWGQVRKSSVVSSRAKVTVGWNANSVVSSIWDIHKTS